METIIELVPTPVLENHSIICGMDISSKVFNMIVFDKEKHPKVCFEDDFKSIDAFEEAFKEYSKDEDVLAKFKYLYESNTVNFAV